MPVPIVVVVDDSLGRLDDVLDEVDDDVDDEVVEPVVGVDVVARVVDVEVVDWLDDTDGVAEEVVVLVVAGLVVVGPSESAVVEVRRVVLVRTPDCSASSVTVRPVWPA